ncbi:MAG: hypothetical protein GY703_01105 [Gammaproteobacteria bacterium]|nr:hypothetical protein [Gammaproteobacteria bacterium]
MEPRSGKVTKVLLARVRFKRIWDLLAELELPSDTEAFLVSVKGRVLAHRLVAMVLSQTVINLPEMNGRHTLINSEPGLVAKQPLSLVGEPAFVVVSRQLESALAVATNTR